MYCFLCSFSEIKFNLTLSEKNQSLYPLFHTFFLRLYKTDLKVKFVTNTTKESKRVLQERLLKIGFDIREEQVFTSLTAARNLIDKRKLSPLLLVDDKALEDFEGMEHYKDHYKICLVMPELSWASDGSFNFHRATIMDSFSCIPFLRQFGLNFCMRHFINIMLKYLHLRSRNVRFGSYRLGIETFGGKLHQKRTP